MAITKQTAKKSTGGKAPRVELAMRAARNPIMRRQLHPKFAASDEWTSHRWIMFTGSTMSPWLIQSTNESMHPERFSEGSREIPQYVEKWCRLNPSSMLDTTRCERWGLLVQMEHESAGEDGGGKGDHEEGLEDSESEEVGENIDSEDNEDGETDDDNADDDEDNGKKVACKKKITHNTKEWVVTTIKLDATGNCYFGRGDRERWCPIIFHMLKICDDEAENMKQLCKIDEWCTENPGLARTLPVGWRPLSVAGEQDFTDIPVIYQSSKANCVVLSAANVITRCDPGTAQLLAKCNTNFNNLRQFAAWFDRNSMWGTRDVFKILRDISGEYPSPRDVMTYILSMSDGVYVVQPIDSAGHSTHAIGVNCFNHTIHDSAEPYAMNLSLHSLTFCCGQGNICVGFLSAYKLYLKPKKRAKNFRPPKE
jgi:hypothetical protein